MIEIKFGNRQPSIETRVRYLNKRVKALIKDKHRPLPRLSEIDGEIEDLNEENPVKQEDEKFEEKVRKLEEEVREIEMPESEDE
jgi:hypothetical protein